MRGRYGFSDPQSGDLARGPRKGEWRSIEPIPGGSFLYAIGCSGFIKIGVSDKPVQRMRDLQCASPHDMRIICLWRVAKDERRDIEAMAHELLRTRRIRNEWFRITEQEAALAGERAVYTKILSRGGALSESRPLTFINGELDDLSPLPTAEVGR
jgi:hypothetical protein